MYRRQHQLLVGSRISDVGPVTLDGADLETLLAVDGKRTVRDFALVNGAARTGQTLKRLQEAGIVTIEPLRSEEERAA